jgi:hypothetical protein
MSEDIVDKEPFESDSGVEPPGRDDHEVGYRKPPKRSQFQKGRSGNPRGRPKEKTNLLTSFEEMLQEADVRVNNGGKVMTKQEAMMRSLVNEAMKANQKAFARFMRLAKRAGLLELDKSKLSPSVIYSKLKLFTAEEMSKLRGATEYVVPAADRK